MASHSSVLAWRIPWAGARQAPLSMKISLQEYWSGLLLPSPGDLKFVRSERNTRG